MKYTEKADIAAKAVKVLDSVTMKRQEPMAVRYFEQSVKAIAGVSIAKCISWKSSPEDAVFTDRIEQARWAMESRLNKPRYTLKDGEWVRKSSDKYFDINETKRLGSLDNKGFRSAQASIDAQMDSIAAQMNINRNPMGGPYSLIGYGHYDHRGQ